LHVGGGHDGAARAARDGSTGKRIVATTTNEVDEIRRRMAWIRRELREDVLGVVESAEAVTDWKHYIRDYPWASVALAAAVGFVLVPRRRKTVKPAEVARAVVAQIQPTVQAAAAEPARKGRGLIGAGLGLLAPIVLRVAQNYATHFVTNWVAQQQEQMAAHMMAAAMGPRQAEPGQGMGRPGGPSQTQGGVR
jgi:ElaB/YqjD/DUF883 family membrane-anchored ribosome-binding protein